MRYLVCCRLGELSVDLLYCTRIRTLLRLLFQHSGKQIDDADNDVPNDFIIHDACGDLLELFYSSLGLLLRIRFLAPVRQSIQDTSVCLGESMVDKLLGLSPSQGKACRRLGISTYDFAPKCV